MTEMLKNAYQLMSNEREDLFHILFNELERSESILIGSKKEWWNNMTDKSGIYVIYEADRIVYCGETDSLKRRMKDLGRTLNHTWRRKVGREFFYNHQKYEPATSKKKFHEEIEALLDEHVKKYCVRILPIPIGRAEFENWIIQEKKPCFNGRLPKATP